MPESVLLQLPIKAIMSICNMLPEIINTVGLIFDIIGVGLLFRYGLPEPIGKDGARRITWGTDEEETAKWKRYKRMSYLALGLLIFGFLLQIVSNWPVLYNFR